MTKKDEDAPSLWTVGELTRDEKEDWDSNDFYMSNPTCDEAKCGATLVWDSPNHAKTNSINWASKTTLTNGDKSETVVSKTDSSQNFDFKSGIATACDLNASKCAKPSA